MANNARTAVARRNAGLDTAYDVLDGGGFLRIYDGSQPATPETALGAQVLLAELSLNTDAFGNAAAGSKAANAISDDTSANATGTATWGSLVTSGGTRILDFEVGTSGADLNLNSVAIQSGARVSVSSFTISQAMQA